MQVNSERNPTKSKRGKSRRKLSQVETQISRETAANVFDTIGVVTLGGLNNSSEIVENLFCELVEKEISWVFVDKNVLLDDLDSKGQNSDFYSVKDAIFQYPKSKLLLGFKLDEEKKNVYFICITEAAQFSAISIIQKEKIQKDDRLRNSIIKKPRPWKSLGSEYEVDENISKNMRPLIETIAIIRKEDRKRNLKWGSSDADSVTQNYVALGTEKNEIISIQRRRYDTAVQASPPVVSSESQTHPGLPVNIWAQYVYDVEDDKAIDTAENTNQPYSVSNTVRIEDFLLYNGSFDLYKDDYQQLIKDERDKNFPVKTSYIESELFIDVKICKNKKIVCASWHPTNPGIIAVAYKSNNVTMNVRSKFFEIENNNYDETLECIYGKNIILIWGRSSSFNPKLYLLSPREVSCLKFCPTNENILIGGLINGQIAIWDITNKWSHINLLGIIDDMKNSNLIMHNSLGWVRSLKHISHVHVTAASSVKWSHKNRVTGVEWISSDIQITRAGVIEILPVGSKSLQFFTCSEDGYVYAWDLLYTPVVKKKKQPPKKSKSIRRQSVVFDGYVSPYARLNLLFKPHFKINVVYPNSSILVPLYSISFDSVTARQNVNTFMKDVSLLDDTQSPEPFNKPELDLGTIDGTVMRITWSKSDISMETIGTSSKVSTDTCADIISWGDAHDGPVISLERSMFIEGLLISVGGKVFAIWKENIKNTPIYWRKCEVNYTSCQWSVQRPSMFFITREDGSFETWDILFNSKKPVLIQSVSGSDLTGIFVPSAKLEDNIVGITDSRGLLKIFCMPKEYSSREPSDIIKLSHLLEREVECKTIICDWNVEWKKINAEMLKRKIQEAEKLAKLKLVKDKERIRLERQKVKLEEEEQKQKKIKSSYWHKCEEEWEKSQESFMLKTLLELKNINKEELITTQTPFMKLKEEEAIKTEKQNKRIIIKDKIFHDIVKVQHPDLIEEDGVAEESKDKMEQEYEEMKPLIISTFKKINDESMKYISEHKFEYQFEWLSLLQEGRKRHKSVDVILSGETFHRNRQKYFSNEIHASNEVSKAVCEHKITENIVEQMLKAKKFVGFKK